MTCRFDTAARGREWRRGDFFDFDGPWPVEIAPSWWVLPGDDEEDGDDDGDDDDEEAAGLPPLSVWRRVATTQIGFVKSTFAIPAREAMPNDSTTLGASAPRLETKNERSRL
mmetsp:Transcript_15910/g.45564  ORF Transcript_15910/g.45564 Transcript_15910/m.45564 type:complete len:112 (+) Transcript_15910:1673-2008(+)